MDQKRDPVWTIFMISQTIFKISQTIFQNLTDDYQNLTDDYQNLMENFQNFADRIPGHLRVFPIMLILLQTVTFLALYLDVVEKDAGLGQDPAQFHLPVPHRPLDKIL